MEELAQRQRAICHAKKIGADLNQLVHQPNAGEMLPSVDLGEALLATTPVLDRLAGKEEQEMRVALISDIHGNLTALEAVLTDLELKRPEHVVCLGDVILGGPQPHQVARRLAGLGWPVVLGNTDAWLLDPRPFGGEDARRQRIDAIGRWCAAQLEAADRAYLQEFQQTIRVPLGNGRALLCYHGSPRSFDDLILPTVSEQELATFLAGHSEDVFAGGHTHQPMVRRHGAALVLNGGSVGRALGPASPGEATPNAGWAEYALVSDEGGRLGVELVRLPFDLATHRRAILNSGMSHAEWEAAHWQEAC